MNEINLKKILFTDVESAVKSVTEALMQKGFGVLSRIDLHQKFKEKLGRSIPPAIILGACHPGFAYDAYMANSDVASLLPCNAVIREVGEGKVSVELTRPSSLLSVLDDSSLEGLEEEADLMVRQVFENINLSGEEARIQ